MSKLKKFIVDKNGQWAHPGKPTMIPTDDGRITMQGVPYPVYGVDDQGNAMMMMPGGEYQFPGNHVYEIPMKQRGGDPSIPNLSKKSWLTKYQNGDQVPSNLTLPSLSPEAQQSSDYAKGWDAYNRGVERWRGLLEEKENKKGRALTTEEKQRLLEKTVKKTDGRKTTVDPNDPKWDFMFKDSYMTWDPEIGPMIVYNKPVEVSYKLTDLDKEKQKIAAETREGEMTPFAKALGMKETDPDVRKRASQKANDQVALRILNEKPQGDKNRLDWLNSLTPEERSTIERSQYAGKLDPDFTSQFSQGVEKNLRNAANIAAVGPIDWYQGKNVFNQPLWTNPDYTPEEAANASALGIMSPLMYPTNLVTGAITGDFGSALQGQRSKPLFTDYRQPEFAAIMSGLYEAGYDPLNAVGIGIMEKVPVGKMTSELAAKQTRNLNKFLASKEGQFYKPKFGVLDVNASPEELKKLAEIDEASSINAYSYKPNDSALAYSEILEIANNRKMQAAKTFIEKSKYLTDDEVRQIFGKSREEILQYKPELSISKPADSTPRGSIDLTRPSNRINLTRPTREYAASFYPEMAQVDQSAQTANQLAPPPETVYLDLDGNNITSGYQSGSYAAQRAAENLPPPPAELNPIFNTPSQNYQRLDWEYIPPSWNAFYNTQQPLSLSDELRKIPRNIKGIFNLTEKQPDRLATPYLYAFSYSTPREMLADVTDKLNSTILDAEAGKIVTGSTNTSHNSYLVQMDYIAKNAGKEDLSEPIFLGYRPMNDAGFLSNAGIPKSDIISYINNNLNKIQKKRGVNFNFGNKPTYMDEYGNIMIPQYGVKKLTPKGEFTGIKKKHGGWISKYQVGGQEMPLGLPLKEQNPYLVPEYNQPRNSKTGDILPDPQRPRILPNVNASEYKVSYDTNTPDEIQIPTIVSGQYIGNKALDRYMLTGDKFKTMADPSSYSQFYDMIDQLGLMKQKKGGSTTKNQYINNVPLKPNSWLNKYQ